VAHAEARETVTPQAKNALVGLIESGQAPLDAQAVDIFHRCTGCGLHATACELDVEVAPVLFDARAAGVDAGVVHPALVGLSDEIPPPTAVVDSCDTAWFAGCSATPSHAEAGLSAARRLDPDVGSADVGCCGYPLLAAGRKEEFIAHAAAMARALSGVGRIITGDPICAWTLRKAWPEPVDAVHIAEVAQGGSPRRGLGRVAYHDPCHLSRKLGVTEQPRALVEAATGAPPAELAWASKGGWCSGGGGLLPRTAPDTAAGIAADLMDQVAEAAADTVVTACPRCHAQLSEAAGDGQGVRVIDLVELL
jgi:Fe-S oxidoreductase